GATGLAWEWWRTVYE
nr:Chain C, Pneumolysin-derived peptide [Streptococcus pneumoniae]7T2A_F Chain F, Pneumolysin-derived peptide [Streptococcus pneumoniae]7T2B_C Chain C, Pneumolysin-derived peptide [Streptococcus pneumoniae]7T2B_H Chain H, Pneumolysin-derived peptide [Streptococcus pneumoniae]7T2B_M Chain M, Pneumolysin-derived peptide [Streptococcus pneumoniae]7T2B_R Chain R, Pneumolysin-derived peptide [Streptococcus pneumoniae]7T2C_C Chain C, Pneumolysin-derived peptide [Streptococcus pneumoniae]7T2D_C Cha